MFPKASASRSRCVATRLKPSSSTATRASASPSMSASARATPVRATFRRRRCVKRSMRRSISPASPPRTTAPACRCRAAGQGLPDLDLFHPWDLPVEEAIELAGAARTPPSPPARHPQFGRRFGFDPAGAFHLRQQPRLHGRLPELAPVHFVLGDRRRGRRHAARRLVHHPPLGQANCRRRRRRPLSPPSARWPGWGAQASRPARPGAVRGAAGHRPARPFRAGRQRRGAVPQVVLPARQSGQADLFAADQYFGTAAPAARHGFRHVRQRWRGDQRSRGGHRRRAARAIS
jgi:hypothetical protein